MQFNKDADDVVEFMLLIQKLKDLIDDDPEGLAELAQGDGGIKSICTKLFWKAHQLRQAERAERRLFTAPVDPKFISTWRDFEKRYEIPLKNAAFSGCRIQVRG
jgi:hypothetical protein